MNRHQKPKDYVNEPVQRIYADDTLDGSEGEIAIIIRYNGYRVHERKTDFVTDKSSPLQLASIFLRCDDEVKAHYHLPRRRTLEQTQEVIIVIVGSIYVSLYDNNRSLITNETLLPGDTIIFLSGGHAIKAMDDTKIIEVKLGPYTERKEDKVDFPTQL